MKINKISGLALGGIMLAACQSNSYKVYGTAETLADSEKVYFTTDVENTSPVPTDSAVVKGGKFTFEGIADSMRAAMIYSKSGKLENAMLITEPGTIMVRMGADSQSTRVWGTFCNNKWQALADSTLNIGREIDRIARYIADNSLTYEELTAKQNEMKKLEQRFIYIIIGTRESNADNEFGQFVSSYYKDVIAAADSTKSSSDSTKASFSSVKEAFSVK